MMLPTIPRWQVKPLMLQPKSVAVELLIGFAAMLIFPCILRGETAATQPAKVQMLAEDRSPVDLGFGSCQWLYPLDSPKKKLVTEPTYHSAKPVYYAAVFGDAADNVFSFVIDESGGTGKGYDTLYVDLDNDGRLDGPGEKMPFVMSTTSLNRPVRLKFQIHAGRTTLPYWVNFNAFPYKDEKNPIEKIHANLRNGSYRSGQALIGGKVHRIALADLNSDGLFNGAETGRIFTGDRFFVDLNDNGDFKDDRGEDGQPGFPYGRYTKIDGRWYTIVAAPGGDEVSIAPATPQLGQILASQWVATAALSSPQQACFLRFANGRAEAIAGEYHIRSLELEAKDNAGVVWRTSGRCSSGSALTVRTGQVTELPVQGAPLLVTPTVAAADQALMIGWRITGPAGEEFTWPQSNPGTVKPGFEVRDARGITVASAKFEYG